MKQAVCYNVRIVELIYLEDNMVKDKKMVNKLCISAMFIAIGWLVPFLSGQNTALGNMLCFMHIPVIVAGFVLGPGYGAIIGAVTPITRFMIFGMPPIYPIGVCMAVELTGYGFLSGFLFRLLKKRSKFQEIVIIYISLIGAMLGGRLLWGAARVLCGVFSNTAFTWKLFMTGAFVTAWPGILIQIFLIPAIIIGLNRSKIMK